MERIYKSNINSILSTRNLAQSLSKLISVDSAILLYGPLGSGKSTVARFILQLLGQEFQGSPTFGLIHHYSLNTGLNLLHADLYRDSKDVIELLMEHNSCAYIIEWPTQDIVKFFPHRICVTISFDERYREAVMEII